MVQQTFAAHLTQLVTDDYYRAVEAIYTDADTHNRGVDNEELDYVTTGFEHTLHYIKVDWL